MANMDQRFEKFRCDFIAHLSARFDLAPDVVVALLDAWLLDRRRDERDGQLHRGADRSRPARR